MVQSHTVLSQIDQSLVELSCAAGYHFPESLISKCMSGQWNVNIECVKGSTTPISTQSPGRSYNNYLELNFNFIHFPFLAPTINGDNGGSSSLSTAEAVATTAVVCVVCSFTAGLLLGVLLTQCHVHCHRKQKRGQTPPVYEDISLDRKPHIELNNNKAYGHVNTTNCKV